MNIEASHHHFPTEIMKKKLKIYEGGPRSIDRKERIKNKKGLPKFPLIPVRPGIMIYFNQSLSLVARIMSVRVH